MGKWPRQGEEGPESVHPAPYLPIDHRNQSNRKMPTSPRSQTSRPSTPSLNFPTSFILQPHQNCSCPDSLPLCTGVGDGYTAPPPMHSQLKSLQSTTLPGGGGRSRLPPICIRHWPGYLSGASPSASPSPLPQVEGYDVQASRTLRPVHRRRVDLGGRSHVRELCQSLGQLDEPPATVDSNAGKFLIAGHDRPRSVSASSPCTSVHLGVTQSCDAYSGGKTPHHEVDALRCEAPGRS